MTDKVEKPQAEMAWWQERAIHFEHEWGQALVTMMKMKERAEKAEAALNALYVEKAGELNIDADLLDRAMKAEAQLASLRRAVELSLSTIGWEQPEDIDPQDIDVGEFTATITWTQLDHIRRSLDELGP